MNTWHCHLSLQQKHNVPNEQESTTRSVCSMSCVFMNDWPQQMAGFNTYANTYTQRYIGI